MEMVREMFYRVLEQNSVDGICTLKDGELAQLCGKKIGSIQSYLTQLYKLGCITQETICFRDELGRYTGKKIRKISLVHQPEKPPEKIFCTPSVNDIATTHPEVIKYLKYPEDVHKYSHGSEKKVWVKCPDCGYEKLMMVCELCNSGFTCTKCGDKISYPNKFIRAFLDQLPIENVSYEYINEWTQGKRYDDYFEYDGKKYLVEVDGFQHHRDTQWSTHEWQYNNDKLKTELAEQNGFFLIRIDCGRSRNYKIEQELQSSLFAELFDLSSIDWNYCRQKAMTNQTIEICEYYNQHPDMTNGEIAKHFHVGKATITSALKRGREIGICDSDGEERRIRFFTESRHRHAIPIEVFDNNQKLIGSYPSLSLCLKDMNDKYPNSNFNPTMYGRRVNRTEELITDYKGFYFRRLRKR